MNENNHIESSYEPSNNEAESLTLFHEGQKAALNFQQDAALAKLHQSLIIAKRSADKEWISYIEGTIAYKTGDLTELKRKIPHAGANAEILSRLARGLERKGNSDYREDYSA